MRRIIILLFIFINYLVNSQIYNPVKWTTSVDKISDSEFYLITNAVIKKGWNIYAQKIPKGGPIPTTFTYKPNSDYKLIDNTIEGKGKTSFDKVFKMKIKKFSNQALFKQKIKLLSKKTLIHAELEFMVCNEERCLPPKVIDISFEVPFSTKKIINNNINKSLSDIESNTLLYGISKKNIKKPDFQIYDKTEIKESKNSNSKSLLSIFLIAFLSGFAALLTPCVFPMIPMTVSYFTKQSKNKLAGIKNAIFYGLSIIAIYVFLGYVITAIFGADSLNALSTNILFNVIFFLILVFFALSFFGFYELTLPSSWSTKIDNQADRSGLIGIFFMALALAVVSFSCTGPIVGTLLVDAASKGGIAPIIGMFGFSLAIALPFAFFAAFPGWLNSLPKSGGWMNSVKVTLGFLELALAFKFLSNADLVAHWNFLKYEPFMIIWILIFGALALYLFGVIKFSHDSPIKKLSFIRMSFALLVSVFTIYLISGFKFNDKTKTFKPLFLLSGLAPPLGYSYFYPNKCPNNLNCFKDLKEGLFYAKKVNKPIMLDFTGYACVNCRKMEEHVWPIKKVDNILRNDYVLISLYVDDKKELPKEQQIVVKDVSGDNRRLKTYGNKWSHFQAKFFNTNSQPYYVLLSSDGEQLLTKPVGYVPNVDKYLKWLQKGKERAKNTLDNLFNSSNLID